MYNFLFETVSNVKDHLNFICMHVNSLFNGVLTVTVMHACERFLNETS